MKRKSGRITLKQVAARKKNIAVARSRRAKVSKGIFKHEYKKQIKRGMSKDFAVSSAFGRQYAHFGESGLKKAKKHYSALARKSKSLKFAVRREEGHSTKKIVSEFVSANRMQGRWAGGAYLKKASKKSKKR